MSQISINIINPEGDSIPDRGIQPSHITCIQSSYLLITNGEMGINFAVAKTNWGQKTAQVFSIFTSYFLYPVLLHFGADNPHAPGGYDTHILEPNHTQTAHNMEAHNKGGKRT